MPEFFASRFARGLVSEDDGRLVGQGAGNGHALLLAARELGGEAMGLVAQTNITQQRPGPRRHLLFGEPAQLAHGHHHMSRAENSCIRK